MPTENQSNVPFYLRKAERPKAPTTFNVHKEDIALLNTDAYKSVRSSLVRYFFDCFRANVKATPAGFVHYKMSGEKDIK